MRPNEAKHTAIELFTNNVIYSYKKVFKQQTTYSVTFKLYWQNVLLNLMLRFFLILLYFRQKAVLIDFNFTFNLIFDIQILVTN